MVESFFLCLFQDWSDDEILVCFFLPRFSLHCYNNSWLPSKSGNRLLSIKYFIFIIHLYLLTVHIAYWLYSKYTATIYIWLMVVCQNCNSCLDQHITMQTFVMSNKCFSKYNLMLTVLYDYLIHLAVTNFCQQLWVTFPSSSNHLHHHQGHLLIFSILTIIIKYLCIILLELFWRNQIYQHHLRIQVLWILHQVKIKDSSYMTQETHLYLHWQRR